ncbi:MAG: methylmalonyl-CoA mutase family protein, partial [Myxococcales bacterium]
MSESEKARARREAWEKKELAEFIRKTPESREKFETASGIKVHRIYTPEDEVPFDEIGLPGQHPFTRGPYP